MKKETVWAKMELDQHEELEKLAEKFGMTKSSMIALTSYIGIKLLKSLIDPESLISAEKMADIMVEAEKKGVEFKLPNDELGKYGY